MGVNNLLPLATKLWQGNVFSPVCDSVYGGCLCLWGLCPGGSLSKGGLCPGRSLLGGPCPGGSVGGLCPKGVSVHVALCLGVSAWGREVSVRETPPTVWLCAGGTYPTEMHSCYCPQRSCEGYVFTPVCLSTGGSASVHPGIPPPPRSRHPQQSRHPPEQTHLPPEQAPPPPHHPQQTATVPDGTHPNAYLSSNFITTIKMTT